MYIIQLIISCDKIKLLYCQSYIKDYLSDCTCVCMKFVRTCVRNVCAHVRLSAFVKIFPIFIIYF